MKPAGPPLDRLAVYGSLAPGQRHHDELDGLTGTWTPGTVRGRLATRFDGYLALTLEGNEQTPVLVFESADLQQHWERLDDFEGDGYLRVETTVETAAGQLTAWIYVAN